MPKNIDAIIRYYIIDDCLKNKRKPFPDIIFLKKTIEEKLNRTIGVRTVQKDIKDLRANSILAYYAPIKFSKKYGGYYYDDADYSIRNFSFNEKELDAIEIAGHILLPFREIGMVDDFNKAVDKIFATIDLHKKKSIDQRNILNFEKVSEAKGINQLPFLINSIRLHKVVRFEYFSYEKENTKTITLSPYLLKEYHNKWHVIGWSSNNKELRIFNIGRISKLKTLNKSPFIVGKFNQDEFFKHVFGIAISRFEPEKFHFVTSVKKFQYFKFNFIHNTQTLVSQDKNFVEFTIEVYPCDELKQFVLGNLDILEVTKPKWFLNKINEIVKDYIRGLK